MTILNRISQSVRDQNWFAVALEFIIVVVGIAVGFQLTQAYDRAQQSAREESYLSGIATDFYIFQRLLTCRVEGSEEIARGLDHVIDAMDGVTLTEGQNTRALWALTLGTFTQEGLPLQGNLQALVQGDLVDTISDDRLRGRMLEAQSTATVSLASINSVNDMIIQTPRFDAHLRREQSAASGGFYVVSEFDAAGMAAATGTRDALINLSNYHRVAARSVSFQMESVLGVLERLEELGAYDPQADADTCLYGPQPTADLE